MFERKMSMDLLKPDEPEDKPFFMADADEPMVPAGGNIFGDNAEDDWLNNQQEPAFAAEPPSLLMDDDLGRMETQQLIEERDLYEEEQAGLPVIPDIPIIKDEPVLEPDVVMADTNHRVLEDLFPEEDTHENSMEKKLLEVDLFYLRPDISKEE